MPGKTGIRGRVGPGALILGAVLLTGSGALVAPPPAYAASTAVAWVTSFAINYEAGVGQENSVVTTKIVNSLGTLWQISDAVPITAGAGCYHPYRGATLVWCQPGSALVIGVRTLDLNDTVTINSPNTVVYAGAGNDTVYTANDPAVINVAYGEDGADLIVSGASRDTIDGGPGQDKVSYQYRTTSMCASLNENAGWPGPGTIPANCLGLPGEDVFASIEDLTGSPGGDFLDGDIGPNRLNGGLGDDFLYGASGDDVLFGGVGNDVLASGQGEDVLLGQDGNDILINDVWGTDFHDGGPGHDRCEEQLGAEIVAVNCEEIW